MEMKEKVLQSDHYLFDSKPLIFKKWSKDLEMKKSNVITVPTWVQFHHLPLKFWGTSLPKITGLIGNYIKSDNSTEQRTKLCYARVMVEVAVDKQLPEKGTFKDETGEVIKIDVEYEWKPITCGNCHKMGHHKDQCRKGKPSKPQLKGVQQVWRPVVKPVEIIRQNEEPKMEITRKTKTIKEMDQVQWDMDEVQAYSKNSFGALSYKEVLSPAIAVINGSPKTTNFSYG
ncbi:hypothetical protein vseg_017828 [Gypsophila vaccaria]